MKIKAPCPDGVRLLRDEHGVPHIVASDLLGAVWGMGYCHALDRGMQMGLMRVLGQGRLAERFDPSDDGVAIDTFFRRMNWSGKMQREVDALTDETRELVEAYCDGVNARFAQKRPWEFALLGYRPEPWRPEDCVLISRMVGYLTLAQSQAEVERLFVQLAQSDLSDAKLEAMFPGGLAGLDRELLRRVRLHERVVPEALSMLPGAPRAMASNNWVVAASHSATGHALMANDPHLEVNRLPNVWAELVVELPDDTICCATMPGLAATLIGRKNSLAWGATYTFMDAVDSWVEEVKGGTYRRGESWVPFVERRETILRKKGEPVQVVFYENEHGVLDGDPHEPGFVLCTRWSSGDSGARSLEASTAMWKAHTVTEGMAAWGAVETSWNWVFADDTGSIGYQMSGLLPIRHPDASGFAPMPGWDPAYDWQGYAPIHELPRCVDPEQGFIVTANHDLNHLGVRDCINMPMGDYRARRIATVLAEAPCDLDTFRRLHMDVHSLQAETMMALLAPVLPDTPAADALRGWDCAYDPDSVGASLFEDVYRELLLELLGRGGMGVDVVTHLLDGTGVFIDFYQHVDWLLLADSPWLEGRELSAVYRTAFDRAAQGWAPTRWGDRNRVKMTHILLGGKLPAFLGFDYGPVELRGGRATPHQGQVYQSAGRTTSFAPSIRILADLGEAILHSSMAGGPSDRRFSKGYTSGMADWLAGKSKALRRLS